MPIGNGGWGNGGWRRLARRLDRFRPGVNNGRMPDMRGEKAPGERRDLVAVVRRRARRGRIVDGRHQGSRIASLKPRKTPPSR